MMVNENGNGSQPPIFTVANSGDPDSFVGGATDGSDGYLRVEGHSSHHNNGSEVSDSKGPKGFLTGTDGSDGSVEAYKEGLLGELMAYFSQFVCLSGVSSVVISTWVMAAWMYKCWDFFPILSVTSPEKECGKSTLLKLLFRVTPKANAISVYSPSSLYRSIESGDTITAIMDEVEVLNKRTDYNGQIIDILCKSVEVDSSETRSVREGKDFESKRFSLYGPKVLACIGSIQSVLASRCLDVRMQKITKDVSLSIAHRRNINPPGVRLYKALEKWSEKAASYIPSIYENTEYLSSNAGRKLGDCLLPLQTILDAEGFSFHALEQYARDIESREKREAGANQTIQSKALSSCREVFIQTGLTFIKSTALCEEMNKQEEEPWGSFNDKEGIKPLNLAKYLGIFDIRPKSTGSVRGYARESFEDAWERYLPPYTVGEASVPVNPSEEGLNP